MPFTPSKAVTITASCAIVGFSVLATLRLSETVTHAQLPSPSMLISDLAVRTVVTGLTQPTSMAFLGDGRFFVIEKGSGKVKLVVNGKVQSEVLDLAVNNASERGLLGIALHPNFPSNPEPL